MKRRMIKERTVKVQLTLDSITTGEKEVRCVRRWLIAIDRLLYRLLQYVVVHYTSCTK